jgi:release factor glutamine methyltransferase
MHRIIDILTLSADYLEAHGVQHPRLNAELILADVLGKSRLDLYLEYDKPLVESELSSLRKLLRQRADRKPLQYILGKTEFFSLPFTLTETVFIPRPETEILVEEVVAFLARLSSKEEITVLDVGTGCGCIAVSVAHSVANCRVYASDISPDAIAVARDNANRNGVGDRVAAFQGNLFGPFIEQAIPKADAIVSNPPYIPERDWTSLPDEVKRFEPRQALLGGDGGVDVLRRIIESAELLLKPGGGLFLEIGEGQKDPVVGFLTARQKYIDIGCRKDYNNMERVVYGTLSSR